MMFYYQYPSAPNTTQMNIDFPIQCSTPFSILLTFTNWEEAYKAAGQLKTLEPLGKLGLHITPTLTTLFPLNLFSSVEQVSWLSHSKCNLLLSQVKKNFKD